MFSEKMVPSIDCQLGCCRLTRTDGIRNRGNGNRMRINSDAFETIDCKRLRWYGHVQRMRDEGDERCYLPAYLALGAIALAQPWPSLPILHLLFSSPNFQILQYRFRPSQQQCLSFRVPSIVFLVCQKIYFIIQHFVGYFFHLPCS